MSILVFIDQHEGEIKKASLEALCYGTKTAKKINTTTTALVLGSCNTELSILGNYGSDKVLQATNEQLKTFDATVYAAAIQAAVEQEQADVVIFPHNFNGRALAPMLSVKLKAGLVAGAVSLPDTNEGFVVKKGAFSGKAYAYVAINTDKKIITLNPNSFPVEKTDKQAEVTSFSPELPKPRVTLTSTQKLSGDIPLTEADIIVSGGRGLKGPENWGMIEELAHALGAATACSRPVADSGWRPHHEHVGQTGITVRPNLYMAIGISGAIQHLAGVNNSKYIVVINKDPEAPFFKAADYGMVGDAFEIVPKLTEAVKKYKAGH